MYRIPIMSIEDTLVNLSKNPQYIELMDFCHENLSEGAWYYLQANLGRMWYPEVETNDVWLVWKIIQKYGGTKE
jgi:hypothetical protein